MDDTDLILFKGLESMQDSNCHGNQKKKKTLKILSETTGPYNFAEMFLW